MDPEHAKKIVRKHYPELAPEEVAVVTKRLLIYLTAVLSVAEQERSSRQNQPLDLDEAAQKRTLHPD